MENLENRAEQSRAEQSTCRLSWLDILKGIGIILVLVGHIYANKTVFTWLYSFHMPLFFFAAGWVYKQKPVLADVKRRIQTIVIPYFTFGLLDLIYWQLIERRFRDSDMSFLLSFFGLLSGQYDYLDFNVHLWFLPCFFVTVVFYNVLVSIGGKKLAWIVSALMSVAYIVVPLPGLSWGIDRAFKYIGFYAIGSVCASVKMDKKIMGLTKQMGFIVAAALLATNFLLAYNNLDTGVMWFVTGTIGILAVLVVSVTIRRNRILEYLGRISLIVLCIHGPVYRVLVKIVSVPLRMSTDAVRENLLLALLVTAMTLGVCAVAYKIISRFMPWMIGRSSSTK